MALPPDDVQQVLGAIRAMVEEEGLLDWEDFPLPPSTTEQAATRSLEEYLQVLRSYMAGNSRGTHDLVLRRLNQEIDVAEGGRIVGIDLVITPDEAELLGRERIDLRELPDTSEAVNLLDEAIAMVTQENSDG